MFKSLYARLLVVFMTILIAAMALLSVLLYQRIRDDKVQARLDELTKQAEDVAYLASQHFGGTSSPTTNKYMMWKAQEIMTEYDAVLLIIDRMGNTIPIGNDTMEFIYDFPVDETLQLISQVLNGYAFQGKHLLESGNPMFTVAVPYLEENSSSVLGAVIIHTSEQNIEASYRDILNQGFKSMLITFSLGAVLILIVSQLIARPLRSMAAAADRFARGDFSQKLAVESKDEVGRLAEALNSMATELDKLEQTRREFVANVSHELRSPLTSMQGFINGILDGTVPEAEQEHYLGVVLDETRRLNKLITTLLDLSHIESGQVELIPQRFDINEMIYRVLFRQESRINELGMEVDIDFQEEQCYVHADADRIEQVLINLVDNAIKYGHEAEGHLRLSTVRSNGTVTVTVGNDSEPIPPDDLAHLFDRFYKVDKAHTTGKGTGLGLAIAKSIIDQHGQRIGATSTQEEGTVFSFTLEGA